MWRNSKSQSHIMKGPRTCEVGRKLPFSCNWDVLKALIPFDSGNWGRSRSSCLVGGYTLLQVVLMEHQKLLHRSWKSCLDSSDSPRWGGSVYGEQCVWYLFIERVLLHGIGWLGLLSCPETMLLSHPWPQILDPPASAFWTLALLYYGDYGCVLLVNVT